MAPRIGDRAPDFTLEDTSGARVTLSEVTRDRIVHLVFNRGFI
ncbi:MAG: redoxin domain-containing protein [Myxococcales bacterium]|nr:redoxin domain-containing protein [Myxococcales bacterium]